jgi:aspartokinase/homoserine dehydrogenase 1
MKVLKFGGTSVGSVNAIKAVKDIVADALREGSIVVVVSALSGVTNKLIRLAEKAGSRQEDYLEDVATLAELHFETSRTLLSPVIQSANYGKLRLLLNQLEDVLHGIFLIGECSKRSLDFVASFGEQLSAHIVADYLCQEGIAAEMVNAKSIIRTNSEYTNATPDLEVTFAQVRDQLKDLKVVPVVTGFIASDHQNYTTTLGRGGSDYTAALIAAALNAKEIEIWTDVDGMLSSDPRRVPKAFSQPEITYQEASEMSHFGAKVIYPPTLVPAVKLGIPIRIANTFNQNHPGTRIHKEAQPGQRPVRGISCIEKIAILNLFGTGLIGVAGMCGKIFAELALAEVNIILISQASSEQNLCIVIAPEDGPKAMVAAKKAFDREIERGLMEQPELQIGFSVIAVIGEGMRKHTGISAKLFKALGNNGVNIKAAAQGSSELNISIVVEQKDLNKGLNALHDAFFLDQDKTLNLFLLGPGLIGKTLLNQLAAQQAYLAEHFNLAIRLVGIANSKSMLFEPNGIEIGSWHTALAENGTALDPEQFIANTIALNLPNTVVADCTSGALYPAFYLKLLEASIAVVTPNKVGNSSSYLDYKALKSTALRYNAPFLYETNVGAGLPIINTLQSLVQSGDPVLKIEAVLSGTLSYIFNTFSKTTPFYKAVAQAQAAGYTEPDPRDDLSGLDMARKVLILAREIGLPLEAADIEIHPILPEVAAKAKSVEAFYEVIEAEQPYFDQLIEKAKDNKLRYIGCIENGKASISLQMVDSASPFYNLNGSENMVVFKTMRYNDTPLVVKGPGAGAAVTAAGVFADIVRCAKD